MGEIVCLFRLFEFWLVCNYEHGVRSYEVLRVGEHMITKCGLLVTCMKLGPK